LIHRLSLIASLPGSNVSIRHGNLLGAHPHRLIAICLEGFRSGMW
jgi:hypothetical protein